MERNKLYIWESTMSGPLNDGVFNIHGDSFAGAQVRDLDDVVCAANHNSNNRLCYLPLKDEFVSPHHRHQFTRFFDDHNGSPYNFNPCLGCFSYAFNLFASLEFVLA